MRVRFYQVRPQLNVSSLFSFCPLADSSSSANNNATSHSWPSWAAPLTHYAHQKRRKRGRLPSAQPTEGKASATRGLSKLSCDTARRRGAPALSSLVAHNLGFLEAPSSSSSSSPPTFFSVLSLFFPWKRKDGKERQKTKQQVKLRLSPWTVARLRAWANCTNYSDTPAATSIRRNYFIILGLHTLISSFSSPAPRKRQSEWLCILRSVLTPNVVAFKNRSSIIQIYIFVYIMLLQFSYGNEREL